MQFRAGNQAGIIWAHQIKNQIEREVPDRFCKNFVHFVLQKCSTNHSIIRKIVQKHCCVMSSRLIPEIFML